MRKSTTVTIVIIALVAIISALTVLYVCSYRADIDNKRVIENNYQNSFYQLRNGVNNMQSDLSKMLVTSSPRAMATLASDAYRHSQMAVDGLCNLPLEQSTINSTSKFINQVGDYCNSMSIECITDGTINRGDSLEEMYIETYRLNNRIDEMMVRLNNGESFMDSAEGGLSTCDLGFDNTIGNSVEYPELIYDGPFSDSNVKRCYKALDHLPTISADEAVNIATEAFSDIGFRNIKMVGRGDEPPAYLLHGNTDGGDLFVAVSVNGGKIVQAQRDHRAGEVKVSEQGAVNAALAAAHRFGYVDMECVWYNSSEGVAYVNLAPKIDDVIYYTDLVKVKVDLSNREIIGFEATGYCKCYHDRELVATMDEEAALSMVDEHLNVSSIRLVLVPHNLDEILCYEIACEYKGLDYFIYIDSYDGSEVAIMRVIDDEQGKMVI